MSVIGGHLFHPLLSRRTGMVVYMKARSWPLSRAQAFIPSLSRPAGMGVTEQQAGCSTKNGSLSDRSADEIFTAFNIN